MVRVWFMVMRVIDAVHDIRLGDIIHGSREVVHAWDG